MSTVHQQTQDLLGLLYSNPNSLRSFLSDREQFCDTQHVNAEVKATVSALDTESLQINESALYGKRLAAFKKHFEYLFVAPHNTIFLRLYREACALYTYSNIESMFDYAERVGSYLFEKQVYEDLPDYLLDLTKYYLALVTAKKYNMPSYQVDSKPLAVDVIPTLYPNACLHEFNFMPEDMIAHLSAESEAAPTRADNSISVLIYARHNKPSVNVLEPDLALILHYCNGAYTISELLNMLKNKHQFKAEDSTYVEKTLLPQLVDMRWIYYA